MKTETIQNDISVQELAKLIGKHEGSIRRTARNQKGKLRSIKRMEDGKNKIYFKIKDAEKFYDVKLTPQEYKESVPEHVTEQMFSVTEQATQHVPEQTRSVPEQNESNVAYILKDQNQYLKKQLEKKEGDIEKYRNQLEKSQTEVKEFAERYGTAKGRAETLKEEIIKYRDENQELKRLAAPKDEIQKENSVWANWKFILLGAIILTSVTTLIFWKSIFGIIQYGF